MIEVLVALLVLSIGLLGLAMLQVESIKHNTDAYFRTQATLLAYDIIDRMRLNRTAANAGAYVASAKPSTAQTCGNGSGCSDATQVAQYDLTTWYQELESALPRPSTPSSIASNGNVHVITVRWDERGILKERAWTIEL